MAEARPVAGPATRRARGAGLGWSVLLLLFWAYRCLYSVAGQVIVVRLTTLGDSARYQGAISKFDGINAQFFTDSTTFLEGVGLLLFKLFGDRPILIDVVFQTIAFYGIARLLLAVEPHLRAPLAFALLLPSFNLWTSVAGKESVIVFSLGVLCSLLVESYYNRARLAPIHVLAGALLLVFKPHYYAALAFIFGLTWAGRRVRQKEALVLVAGIVTLLLLVVVADRVNDLSFQVLVHFEGEDARSTRPPFWVQPYDVFWKAFEGMYLSFVGPTLEEALRLPVHLMAFIESMALCAYLLFLMLMRLTRIPVYSFLIGLFTLFWLLFPNYPFGVMNPGSAVRYRSGYFILVVAIFAFVLSRRVFVGWRNGVVTGQPRRRRIRLVWRGPAREPG
jgi:hypothetical protein